MPEFKLKNLQSLTLPPNSKTEYEIEGLPETKILLVNANDKIHALSPRCTHYGAPLVNGVVEGERITCPWHGACFNISTGDVEDAPALNSLHKFELIEKEDGVYIRGEEADIKSGSRNPVSGCTVSKEEEHVVVVGGGSGTLGLLHSLRAQNYPGKITVISKESPIAIDRPKLSKALIADASKIAWRDAAWFKSAAIDNVTDEVTHVDFAARKVSTSSGNSYTYTKLVLATGGTPRTLPLSGFELGNVFTLRGVDDAQAILDATSTQSEGEKKNIVVIGSSFIGMELANALAKHNVSVVGMESTPLERIMGTEVGKIFQANLENNGVKFYLSASVSHASPSSASQGKVGAVHLKDGTTLPADVVILGVGVRPATDFLTNNNGIALEKDGSILTDENFAIPSLPDVFALGDIATYPYHGPGGEGASVRIEHWTVAQNAGRAAGRAIVHALKGQEKLKPKRFIPVFWSALGGQMRYCGNTVNGYDDVYITGKPEESKFVAYYFRGEVVVAVATMGVDPVMAKCAALMRVGRMPGKKEVLGGVDVLGL